MFNTDTFSFDCYVYAIMPSKNVLWVSQFECYILICIERKSVTGLHAKCGML